MCACVQKVYVFMSVSVCRMYVICVHVYNMCVFVYVCVCV